MAREKGSAARRKLWIRISQFFAFIFFLTALITWYLVSFQAAIRPFAVALFALGVSYIWTLHKYLSVRRCIFILFGAFCIGSVLWVVFMLILRLVNLSADPATLISLPVAYLLGAYLGDRLGKRRNYMPWY